MRLKINPVKEAALEAALQLIEPRAIESFDDAMKLWRIGYRFHPFTANSTPGALTDVMKLWADRLSYDLQQQMGAEFRAWRDARRKRRERSALTRGLHT